MATRKEIVEILADYIEVYPGTKISGKGLVLYAENLEEFDAASLRKAMNKLIRTCKFFPTIAEICSVLTPSTERNVFTPSPEDIKAYNALIRELERNG